MVRMRSWLVLPVALHGSTPLESISRGAETLAGGKNDANTLLNALKEEDVFTGGFSDAEREEERKLAAANVHIDDNFTDNERSGLYQRMLRTAGMFSAASPEAADGATSDTNRISNADDTMSKTADTADPKSTTLGPTTATDRELDNRKLGNRNYAYMSYEGILGYFDKLNKDYPEFVETWDALEKYPDIADKTSWASCGKNVCKVLIVRLTNEKKLTQTTPEIFFSGELHGDEVIGPQVIYEMANLLVAAQKSTEDTPLVKSLKWLLDNRSVYMIAMTNPHGYFHNRRAERGMDPNRDFPYLQPKCMQTVTARTINELFREHLFRAMITFHGGTRILSYEWGSRNHANGRHATEPPDNVAQVQVAQAMQRAAGKQGSRWFYPHGRMTDTIYWVDGGLEDWSYAASWEGTPPINTCKTHTYKDYPESKTIYTDVDIRTMVYLVETDNSKHPAASTLGNSNQMWANPDSRSASHVPRNVRMSLKLLELIDPAILVENDSFRGVGCVKIDSVKLVKMKTCPAFATSKKDFGDDTIEKTVKEWSDIPCHGLDMWKMSESEKSLITNGLVSLEEWKTDLADPNQCLAFMAVFDSDWAKQGSPDPTKPPQTHLAKARILDTYHSKVAGSVIDTTRTKVFRAQMVAETAAASASTARVTPAPAVSATPAPAAITPPTPAPAVPATTVLKTVPPMSATTKSRSNPTTVLPLASTTRTVPQIGTPKMEAKWSANQQAAKRIVMLLGLVVLTLLGCNMLEALRLCCFRREAARNMALESKYSLPNVDEGDHEIPTDSDHNFSGSRDNSRPYV